MNIKFTKQLNLTAKRSRNVRLVNVFSHANRQWKLTCALCIVTLDRVRKCNVVLKLIWRISQCLNALQASMMLVSFKTSTKKTIELISNSFIKMAIKLKKLVSKSSLPQLFLLNLQLFFYSSSTF